MCTIGVAGNEGRGGRVGVGGGQVGGRVVGGRGCPLGRGGLRPGGVRERGRRGEAMGHRVAPQPLAGLQG